MQATVSGSHGNFLAGLHSLSLVRTADLNSVYARISRVQNQGRAAFYFSTEFLGCAECEYFADAVSNCNFALRVATKLGACIPLGLQN